MGVSHDSEYQTLPHPVTAKGCTYHGGQTPSHSHPRAQLIYAGSGVMTWAQLSSIYEPVGGAFRQIFGFDTFDGFPDVHEKDLKSALPLDSRRSLENPKIAHYGALA